MLFAQARDFGRLRVFLADEARWTDVAKFDNAGLLQRVARGLCSGRFQLRMVAVIHSSPAQANAPAANPEPEPDNWVEVQPEPEPVAAPEKFAVSQGQAGALADENRELAEDGTPFKEICRNQDDCEVCKAGQTVMVS